MPRGISIYNGGNDEIEAASVVPLQNIDGVTADENSQSSLGKVTTHEKAEKRLAMAVEFDHMYLGCSDSKASVGKDIEVQHLKDLLLLHLDLIQQQAEQLVAKDKLIKSLRDENENLKSRLDRIDRRVSLSLSKKSNESVSIEPKDVAPTEEPQESPPKCLGSPTSKPDPQPVKSPPPTASKNATCIKSLSPSIKVTSPSNKPSSPSSKPGSPASKPASPASKPASPASKPASPASKPGSPASKPGSPSNKPGSPSSRVTSPSSRVGSPPCKPRPQSSKPGSPVSKPGSPVSKPLPTNKAASPVSKDDPPSSKSVSPAGKAPSPNSRGVVLNRKSLSPQARVSSPPSKVLSPSSKVSPPMNSKTLTSTPKAGSPPRVKPSSPSPKTAPLLDDDEPLSDKVTPQSHLETPSSRSGSTRLARRSRLTSPKATLRERRQRNASQSQSSENDAEVETLSDVLKASIDKDRPRLKRRLDSETDGTPVKRMRSDRDRTSNMKDDGLTDHNLRSRDKSKDRAKSSGKEEDEMPLSPVARPPTPTPRAAALEAKKLRQKLQLKEQTRQGQTYGRKGGRTPTAISVRGEGVLNTSVSYYLPYGVVIQDPNPEEECLQSQVEIPQWGTRILTSLYVMEGTENLEDEIFIKRHAKPEQDEKRRKRWDLQRMREQRHYERLRERYESRQSINEPTVLGDGSLWPCPESATYIHVEDTLPVCAFGQPLARIPPQEFSIPWLTGQSFEGITTRRRKR